MKFVDGGIELRSHEELTIFTAEGHAVKLLFRHGTLLIQNRASQGTIITADVQGFWSIDHHWRAKELIATGGGFLYQA